MDPLTMTVVAVVVAVARVAEVYAETRIGHARTELTQAAAALAPGTEISGTGRDGSTWMIKVPAAVGLTGGKDDQDV